MITSYKIIALAERGMLVEFTDADAVITRQLNLLPPYDLEGNLLTGDALKSHIVGSAPAKEMAAQVKAKADSALLPIGAETSVAPEELPTISGNA